MNWSVHVFLFLSFFHFQNSSLEILNFFFESFVNHLFLRAHRFILLFKLWNTHSKYRNFSLVVVILQLFCHFCHREALLMQYWFYFRFIHRFIQFLLARIRSINWSIRGSWLRNVTWIVFVIVKVILNTGKMSIKNHNLLSKCGFSLFILILLFVQEISNFI
jgi:hypothetical protein